MSEKLARKDFVKEKITEFLMIRDNEGNTLLHHVVKTDDEEFAKNLIARGCDVDTKNNEGDPPLTLAIRENQLEMVKILLNAGANCGNDNYTRKQGPLFIASYHACPEIVKLLIETKADLNALDESSSTPLHMACDSISDKSSNRCKVIKHLIDAGADVHAKNSNGLTPFVRTAMNNYFEEFELILSIGSDVWIDDEEMAFPLMEAAVLGSSEKILTRLIQLGCDVNMTDNNGNSCLHVAASNGRKKMIKFLFDNGARVNVNNNGWDPLCRALEDWGDDHYYGLNERSYGDGSEISKIKKEEFISHVDSFQLLVKNGSNINHLTKDGMTPLYIALENCKRLNIYFVRALLKRGAKFDFDHPSVIKVMNDSSVLKFSYLLLRQAAMFEAQDRDDGPANFNVDNLNDESRRYFALCQRELNRMKIKNIGKSNVTYFMLLVDRDIGPYVHNVYVLTDFDPIFVESLFFIYGDILTERHFHELLR